MTSSTSLRFKKFAEEGELTLENFDVVTEALPELKDGEVHCTVDVHRDRAMTEAHFSLYCAGAPPKPLHLL